jgi:hypothetical protein
VSRTAIPRLAGLAEIAGLLAERAGKPKVSRSYAGQVVKHPDFPPPAQQLAMGPVWAEADVIEYLATPRKPGRKPKKPANEHPATEAAS